MNQTRISIVTPSYNQLQFIETTLRSVKQQHYDNLEHLVMDGASTDGSVQLLERLGALPDWSHLVWRSEPDGGQSDALNKGFRSATGDVIGWLNADDLYRPGCFDAVVRAFERYPGADVVYGDSTWIDERGTCLRIRREIDFSFFILAYHRVLYIPTTSTFFRRRVFDEGYFLDPQYHYAMDYDFLLRLAQAGYRFHHLPALLADFRLHPASKTRSQTPKFRREHNQITWKRSPLLNRLPPGIPLAVGTWGMRTLAAGLRYSTKLIHGHYFSQYRSLASQ
ncbi:MAG TPA: glycosyltransferase family 2 protein [Terriglobales bacterium]|nr:glycosyltransferase family 2 protein [Terriglobales bacterium]